MKDYRNIITKEGWDAGCKDIDSSENPYFEYSSNWSYWLDGWYDAKIIKSQIEQRGMWAAFDEDDL